MKSYKKILSLVICICMLISIFGALGIALGINISSAATNYKNELWLLENYTYMLNKGQRAQINTTVPSAAPCRVAGETSPTCYIPISAF